MAITTLRSELNGTFTMDELDRMMFPIAWSGTMPADEAAKQEAELHDFAHAAKEELQSYYNEMGDGESDYAVKIEDGEVTEIVVAE